MDYHTDNTQARTTKADRPRSPATPAAVPPEAPTGEWGRPHRGLGRKGVEARVVVRSLVVERVFALSLTDGLFVLVVQDLAAQPGAA